MIGKNNATVSCIRYVRDAVCLSAFLFSLGSSLFAQETLPAMSEEGFRDALKLYENGMYSRARHNFDVLSPDASSSSAEGYSVLSDIRASVPGYSVRMDDFMERNPQSVLLPQMKWYHALNLFDRQDYKAAGDILAALPEKQLFKGQLVEYRFLMAYCHLENRNLQEAKSAFLSVENGPMNDYTAPSRYALGYIDYLLKDFEEALTWFEKSRKDSRFRAMSDYYLMECRFMLGDHAYVTKHGDEMYESVPEERKPQLARIVSESWLVLGNADNARRFFDLNTQGGGQPKSRADWFYSGSVLYAVEDYRGAIDSFAMMGEKKDSIGQIASYHMAYSYIRTKNKVAAMSAFKDASSLPFNEDIAEDAYFNWAKLAFDLNSDTSVFRDYLARYSDLEKGDRINSYIAVAALYNRDYEGAVEAYDRIDDLDEDMRSNYMKANYLRAEQLIRRGSYRKAIPCLKIAAYYSEKGSRFNQLTRFWLAESYYRNDMYAQSRELFTELYNTSALYGRAESYLISYNIAYCYYKEGNYPAADRWFTEYLGESSVKYRKEALERRADCRFIRKDYKAASAAYDQVLAEYFNVNDIYPYYQAAVSYGLDRNVDRKIELLSNVMEASPSAEFYPEALFELGRTYAVKEDDDNAFTCFNRIAQTVKDSTFVAKAYIEMGSLARNQSQFNDALGYYKTVVEDMPLSGYAEDALVAIESIYQTRNEPEEYIAYIETIGKGATKTADEKEDMIFNSAEQIFLSENYQKAVVSLQSYLDRYPDGRYAYKADFYMAESYKSMDKTEQACDSYRKVIENGTGSFVELSMLNFANLSYKLERWDDAYGGYSSLYSSALLENNRFVAVTGMMRSAYRGHSWSKAISDADKVLADSRSDAGLKSEAEYVKAKSYLATSRREEAFAIMRRLSSDVSGSYGAESAYLLIQDAYDRGEFSEVEEKVYAFSDAGSGQVYWLAKSFIVLGDSFAERGELEQAKATFESVRDGYSPAGPEDDVLDNVNMRLKRLEDMAQQSL
ncbi:MAG: tetratricopeptide repeat protein [Bacteroidales bacterium]|nr:tetratricopeptide repeat protein [Bacteroidales bacterium]